MNRLLTQVLPLLLLPFVTYAQIRLPRLISDGMVLQRDKKIKVWGWAAAGEKVSLRFRQKEYHTVADNNGSWAIQLPPQGAGGPYTMTFSASNTIEINNILLGDVWLCSGQSNMELTMQRVQDKYAAVIAAKGNSMIRQFTVPDKYDFNQPHNDLEAGEWQEATPEHILAFSAVAYFFAREIYEKYQVPVGLINSALGGSPVEAWLSEDALKAFPAPYAEAMKFRNQALIDSIEEADRTISGKWYARLHGQDQGLKEHWSAAALDDAGWQQMPVPGYWADQAPGRTNGVVWFRKSVHVPAAFINKPVRLWLGRIVDADSVFVNGQFVGTTGYQYPPRRYELPAGVLKAGSNTIAVRVVNTAGRGGFVPDKLYAIATDTDTLHLEGDWKYRQGAVMEPLRGATFIRWKPLGLYNAMIAPLLHYAIKGCIWYQGEANTGRAQEYTALFKALISDWRAKWQQGDFPFLFAQLPGFMEPVSQPAESDWAALRQAQLNTLQRTPRTGMAVTIDLGEWNDIHPLNKQDVGHRLALQAMRLAYGDKHVVASGPLYQSMQVKGNKAILKFADNGSPLTTKNGKAPQYFAIAGPDRQFAWAQADISGPYEITVWSDQITQPVAVRYAWANNPEGANLYNQAGLPASPFEAVIKR
ncbi:sialate O-acetylesterase [Chitinophaga japonensis]|uniref:Sialate O-acetylesterase n=1 Tax=Chitinophaga japonensis TaxID=104662 RepID=A0A562SUW2_CHIJA|nr:sialate O-acetylesterase [Chitinophaga japonensis]TWI84430.1 sialate O-acetylesterase [Chitinophaga japonensis]